MSTGPYKLGKRYASAQGDGEGGTSVVVYDDGHEEHSVAEKGGGRDSDWHVA